MDVLRFIVRLHHNRAKTPLQPPQMRRAARIAGEGLDFGSCFSASFALR